jgi:two-component system, NtrC family, response regulator HydG
MQAGASDDGGTTRSSSGTEPSGAQLALPVVSVFVIAWCREEPERVGELAILPTGADVVLGRGAPDSEPRMRFFRPLPGRLEPTAPLSSRGLSRRQLEVRPGADQIGVRRVGRCPMRINGVECDEGLVSPGDTVAFRQELGLLCVHRPACPQPLRHFSPDAANAFGGADTLGILGESPAVWLLRDELAFAAKSGRHVLLVGESGTGKELAARAIHRLSSRAERPLVARNAATLPVSLMDAEMFGNLKNYPNPGMSDRLGLVGQADGGFLFLDEIGELPAELQSHLLRVLDSGGEYQRLGESTSRRSDFCLLAATNRDPADLRADLVARLTVKVELPPLSERREDIPLLARHLVLKAASESPDLAKRFTETTPQGLANAKVDSKLVEALLRRDYLGNVRELEAVLWQAMGASDGDFVAYHAAALASETQKGPGNTERPDAMPGRARNREPSEQEIREALASATGNVARAAKELGLSSRYALYRRMVKLGIEVNG